MVALEIVQIDASEMDNYSYLVYCPQTMQGAAVDPSMRPEKLLDAAKLRGVTLNLLLNTHGHQDHIAGNPQIQAHAQVKLAAHPNDLPQAELKLEDGAILEIGNGRVEVLHTPGHTPGSLVFRTGNAIITEAAVGVPTCLAATSKIFITACNA